MQNNCIQLKNTPYTNTNSTSATYKTGTFDCCVALPAGSTEKEVMVIPEAGHLICRM